MQMRPKWFPSTEVDVKRKHMRKLIIRLSAELHGGNKAIMEEDKLRSLWMDTLAAVQ